MYWKTRSGTRTATFISHIYAGMKQFSTFDRVTLSIQSIPINKVSAAQMSFLLYEEIKCSLSFYSSKISSRPWLTISGVSQEATAVRINPIKAIFISLSIYIGFCVPATRLNLLLTASKSPHCSAMCNMYKQFPVKLNLNSLV